MAVREEEIQLPVEIGVEEGRAPAHALEGARDETRGGACVFELAAVEVAVQRVAVVGEGGQHQVHAPVAVVVARVGPHPGLRARLAVHRHPAQQAHALEAAIAEVVVEEVGVRVVGDEEIDEAVVVVVGRDDAEAVGARRVAEAVRLGRLDEAAVALRFSKKRSASPGNPAGPTMMRGPPRQMSVRCARTTSFQVVST